MKQKIRRYKLKKELGLFEATVYGVGIILGAGIYALIGESAGLAGNALWMSFIFSAIIASLTGLSFAELSSMYPKEGAEYVYAQKAFRRKSLALFVSLVFIISGVISAATVALGFGGYFSYLIGGSPVLVAAALIAVMSLLNYAGIKDSARYNEIATFIEISGLVLVVMLGMFFFGSSIGTVNYFAMPNGFSGVLIAMCMIFFAYLGFEDLANISEETKNAAKTIPKAMIISLVISTVLYIAVALSAISILGWERLSQSSAPLTEVIESVIPQASILMSIIALFATSNTVLIILIVMSRMLCGVSKEHAFPGICARIGKTGTPYVSILLVMLLSIASLLIGGIGTVAMLTVLGVVIVFAIMNLSLIVLRYKDNRKRPFRSPVNIGKFPVLAFLGLLSSLAMIYYIMIYLI
ncbi:MAG: APC family permease [Candidatus Aenigmatarchaeota archaeon]